jgi:hypothetical protein
MTVLEATIVCLPADGQGAPARLEYVGRRMIAVEVPFKLKDVPLR